ncbi:hypothetical protein BJ742DRAFT_568946 [Cladochytrium replicatum]|nr:hypothetical protein BJ742DRAFT_568946 [Cladochytrium replicatum]
MVCPVGLFCNWLVIIIVLFDRPNGLGRSILTLPPFDYLVLRPERANCQVAIKVVSKFRIAWHTASHDNVKRLAVVVGGSTPLRFMPRLT